MSKCRCVSGMTGNPLGFLLIGLFWSITAGRAAPADGFDFPFGPPDGTPRCPGTAQCTDGWQNVQDFRENNHLGEDWNFGFGEDDLGKPVYAVANGTVTYAQDVGGDGSWRGVIIIRHTGTNLKVPGGGTVSEVTSLYGHLDVSKITAWVSVGSAVSRGQQIGVIGPTPVGSTGPHLHFEIRTDLSIDVGPGYSANATGWIDPSNFIGSNRSVTGSGGSVSSPFTFTTVAGLAGVSGNADGTASAARFTGPANMAVDNSGNVYVSEFAGHTIRKITPGGNVSTLAGRAGFNGSIDGTGSTARFSGPFGVAVDGVGNLYVADVGNHTIRKIAPDGGVTTLAGRAGIRGSSDGIGNSARFSDPNGVAFDNAANLIVADYSNHTIRKITTAGSVTTLAGSAGRSGSTDGTGSAARFNGPVGVGVDRSGNVYVADEGNHTIRKITPSGDVTTIAGLARNSGSTDGTGNVARFNQPEGVVVDSAGNVYVTDLNPTIRKITPEGTATTLAGLAGNKGSSDGTGSAARFDTPYGVAVDSAGNLYVADYGNHTIRKGWPSASSEGVIIRLQPQDRTVTAGASVTFNVTATGAAPLAYQWRIDGVNIPGATSAGHTILNVQTNHAGNYSVLVGNAVGSVISSAAALAVTPTYTFTTLVAGFENPSGITLDSTGNLFVADYGNHTIWKISPSGVVSAVAGLAYVSGRADGTGSAARFNRPTGVALDSTGNVYVADQGNHTIRKITPGGIVSTLAGSVGIFGSTDGNAARFNYPTGVVLDGAGVGYVADYGNSTIRTIMPDGVVSTLAGLAGINGSADGTGSAARFNNPFGVALDGAGNVIVADSGNSTIRKITPGGVVSMLAGLAGSNGNGDGMGSAVAFNIPQGVALDSANNVYVADQGNHTIRKITPGGVVSTLAGLAGSIGSADGTGSAARFNRPIGVAVDSAGNLFVADFLNHTIRRGWPMAEPPNDAFTNRSVIAGLTNSVLGFNVSATKEAGEPNHGVNSGGKSIWWTWTAPGNVSVTIDTIGSSFDTVLAIYTGNSVFNLALVASDRSSGGVSSGFFAFASRLSFSAIAGATYQIAVDGDSGASGNIVLNLKQTPTISPQITAQPQSQTVAVGENAIFSVTATGTPPLTYQWRKGAENITSGTNASFAITNVQSIHTGAYSVMVSNAAGSVISTNVSLTLLPLQISHVGQWPGIAGGNAYHVTVVDRYAYVADGDAGLQVIDVTNPANPVRIGGYDTSGSARDVAVSGQYAYVADGGAGLQVIDVSNPASPVRVGGYDTSGNALGIAVSGQYAYVADDFSGLQIIDVSNPASPVRVGGGTTGGSATAVAGGEAYAFVTDSLTDLMIINVQNPVRSTLDASWRIGGSASGIALSGHYAYVADGPGGLAVFNLLVNLSNFQYVGLEGSYNTSGDGLGVAVSGQYAYVADGSAGLQVIDVANPARLVRVGAYNTSGSASGVAVSGRYAYVADGSEGLVVLNLIEFPRLVSSLANETAVAGSTMTFSASATGSSPLYYQWRLNGSNLVGATNDTLTLSTVTTNDVGVYSLVVSNDFGSVTSGNVGLTVVVPPQNQDVLKRSSVTFRVTVNSPSPVSYSYQWQKDGTNIAGQTNAFYSITGVQLNQAGTYTVLVRTPGAPSTPYSATLSVLSVQRRLPTGYWPGVPLTVQIETAPTVGITSHTVTERLPRDATWQLVPALFDKDGNTIAFRKEWPEVAVRQDSQLLYLQATSINEDGVFDIATRTVKWGPFFDDAPRVLRYTLVPPLGWKNFFQVFGNDVLGPGGRINIASGWFNTITLTGDLSEDGRSTSLPQNTVSLYPLHPADNSPPADNFISIFELSAYAATWRRSLLWPVPPGTIKDDYLTQAGVIWKRGEYYENVGGTPPLNWQPAPLPPSFKRLVAAPETSDRVAKKSLSLASSAVGAAVRSLTNGQVNPPGPLEVTITVTPQPSVTVLVLEEQLPPGWTASNINSGGSIDTNFNKVKWGPFFLTQSSTPRIYTYQAVPAAGAQGVFTLSGLAAFDGTVLNIGGPNQITVGSGSPPQSVPLRAELSGKEIILSWPTNSSGYFLEVSDSLAPASWTRVPQAAVLAGASFSTKIPVAGGSKFYRLRGP